MLPRVMMTTQETLAVVEAMEAETTITTKAVALNDCMMVMILWGMGYIST